MKFKYKHTQKTNTVGIICSPGDEIEETRPHIIKALQKSPFFEEIKESNHKKQAQSKKDDKKDAKVEEAG